MLPLLTSVCSPDCIPDYVSDSESEPVSLGRLNSTTLPPSPNDSIPILRSPPPLVSPNNSVPILRSPSPLATPSSQSSPHTSIPGPLNPPRNDDDTNLRLYMDATVDLQSYASRRGLRKRNFASTHPYLTDQAHYLGLATSDSLNMMFLETQDLEGVVRFLNHIYTKKRQSNPRDFKYKPKNFYAIIGQQSSVAQAKENEELGIVLAVPDAAVPNSTSISQDLEEAPVFSSDSSDLNDNELDNSSCNFSSDDESLVPSLSFLKRPFSDVASISEPLDESSSSGSDSDAIVRVGGKILKERRVLHGALPESAKRLAMYKAKMSHPRPRRVRIVPELRKGLAIKRVGAGTQDLATELGYGNNKLNDNMLDSRKSPSNSPQQSTIDTFGVLSSDSEFDLQPQVDQSNNAAAHDIPSNYWDELDTQLTARGSSALPFPRNAHLATTQTIDQGCDYQYIGSGSGSGSGSESVREEDFIDPMVAGRKQRQRTGTSDPRTARAQRSRSTHSRKVYAAQEYVSHDSAKARSRRQGRARKALAGAGLRQSIIPRSTKEDHTINRQTIAFPSSASRNGGMGSVSRLLARRSIRKKSQPVRSLTYDKEPGALSSTKKASFSNSAMSLAHAEKEPSPKLVQSTLPQRKDNAPPKSVPRTRNILHDQFQFTRQPLHYTTSYEAESIKSRNDRTQAIPTFQRSRPFNDPQLFNANSIVRSIDIQKINNLDQGRTYRIDQDLVTITLRGEHYTLTLIDQKSTLLLEIVFGGLVRILRDPLFYSLSELFEEVYECVRKILVWLLIVQRPILDIIRKRVNVIFDLLQNICNTPSVAVAKIIAPFFILISFINMKICSSRDIQSHSLAQRFRGHVCGYWLLHFALWFTSAQSSNQVGADREAESWYILCSVLNCQDLFWSLLDNALQREVVDHATHSLLQLLYDLSVSNAQAPHDWKCHITVYTKACSSPIASDHTEFLQLVSILHRRHGWKIIDQVLVALFRAVAGRRFANFDDEKKLPRVLQDIHSRYDLPSDTFFEQFLVLLYTHVSDSVSDPASLKRLVRKLLPSSHYQYEPNLVHTAMYINRMNFLLLLQRVTDMDLSSQLNDLTSKIFVTSDINLLLATIVGIRTFCVAAIQQGTQLPVDALVSLLNYTNRYTSLEEMAQIWKSVHSMLNTLLATLSTPSHKLDIFKVFAAIAHNCAEKLELVISDMIWNLLNSLPQVDDFGIRASETFAALTKRSYNVINTNMGRLPLQNPADETRIDALIEKALMVWIRSFRLSPPVKWEVLVLQIYPYIGNSYLRAKYVLFFYKELLTFSSLQLCKDIVIKATLNQMCSFAPTKYLYDMMVALRQSGYLIFSNDKFMTTDSISPFQITHDRLGVLASVLQNIARVDDIPVPTKSLFLKEVLRTLSGEYDSHYLDPGFKEFCVKAVLATERICGSFITTKDLMLDCVLKMGISRHDLEMVNWKSISIKDKLARLHKELVNSLVFTTDPSKVLTTYTLGNDVDLLYHLCSVYSRAILIDQQDKWRLLLVLISFFHDNVVLYKFNIKTLAIDRFLSMVFEYPCYKECTRLTDQYFRLQVCVAVSRLYLSMLVIFDGYKDIDMLPILWPLPMVPGSIKLLDASLYSNYTLFDIHQIGSDAQLVPIAEPSGDEMVSLRRSFAKESKVIESLFEKGGHEDHCLSFDFSF